MATFPDVYFGETSELQVDWTERDDAAFTISSCKVSIAKPDGTKLRDAVAATVSGNKTTYIETYSTANGYAEGLTYHVQFWPTISCGGNTHKPIMEATLLVKECQAT